MTPSIGRIVHYTPPGTPGGEHISQCRAAIVTAVGDLPKQELSLCVLNPTGMSFNEHVLTDYGRVDDPTLGTWHWPERTD